MIRFQLERRGIRDQRVLAVMGRIAREAFVPPDRCHRAYDDCAMGIGMGQTISQPYMVALMTEALGLTGAERVLEVGTGSGYQGAILAELAGHVYTIERIEELSRNARHVLCEALGYENISLRVGDGTLGWLEEAPFDRIMVTAGAPHRPDVLLQQLGEGGAAVVPVGGRGTQSLMRYWREGAGPVRETSVCGCVFVPLIGADGW